jgi:branched-chain amino acid aminotransferase
MINFNGTILPNSESGIINRAFSYGDALFDTMLCTQGKLIFSEEHYFRLLAGMRQLRMDIPMFFTQQFWEKEILKTLESNSLTTARIRTTVFRNSEGFYLPLSNEIGFIIQTQVVTHIISDTFQIGIYKDHTVGTNSLDNIKTTHRLINVLASIYAQENHLDTCILLNHRKQIVGGIHANLFAVFGPIIKTPALSEGCINGIIRQKIIQIISKESDLKIIETELTPFDLQLADEIFLTNSILGIQSVYEFKKKNYNNKIALHLANELQKLFE